MKEKCKTVLFYQPQCKGIIQIDLNGTWDKTLLLTDPSPSITIFLKSNDLIGFQIVIQNPDMKEMDHNSGFFLDLNFFWSILFSLYEEGYTYQLHFYKI